MPWLITTFSRRRVHVSVEWKLFGSLGKHLSYWFQAGVIVNDPVYEPSIIAGEMMRFTFASPLRFQW